jgi:hypothetical protein
MRSNEEFQNSVAIHRGRRIGNQGPFRLPPANCRGWFLAASCLLAFAGSLGFGHEPEMPPSPASSPIFVMLRDGRRFVASGDHRTDDETLWLRLEKGRAAVSTGFTWDLVRSVYVNGDDYSGAEFRSIARYFASNTPAVFAYGESLPPATLSPPQANVPARLRELHSKRVESVAIDAVVANWDRDAESDGIELRIFPQSADGGVTPMDGAFQSNLIVRSYSPDDDQTIMSASPWVWSQKMRAVDFSGRSGAVYRLPFRSTSPDHDLTLQPIGLLRVHLHLAGQGDFFAETPVRLRVYNPVRDQLLKQDQHHDSFGRYRARHW